jgi:hypothetical protein
MAHFLEKSAKAGKISLFGHLSRVMNSERKLNPKKSGAKWRYVGKNV